IGHQFYLHKLPALLACLVSAIAYFLLFRRLSFQVLSSRDRKQGIGFEIQEALWLGDGACRPSYKYSLIQL
ncbi:MAG: hypothetical protein KAW89_11330, partial [Armatimonadetes bacterium]|nr:hypothetical protein [Armatimonadota bacterium]